MSSETSRGAVSIFEIDTDAPQLPLWQRVLRKLYGNIPQHEFGRVGQLSLVFFFIMFSYWLLRSLKDPILFTIVGVEQQPTAKILSLVVVMGLILIYNKLVDHYPKQTLFYLFGSIYSTIFFIISIFLAHPTIGLANDTPDPFRLLGWISFFAIESFGSIIVSLFWAFVNSTTNLESSKSSYGLIIAGAQIGAIIGPSLATGATTFGVPTLYAVCAGSVACMTFAVRHYSLVYLSAPVESAHKPKKSQTGLLEGIRLLVTYPYLLGIFGCATIYEVIATIMDYQMKVLATSEATSTEEVAQFLGFFGQATNTLSLFLSLLGTSMIVRKFGVRWVLMAFPTCIFGLVILAYFNPNKYTFFFILFCIKGLSYSLNNPAKEILYIPTSDSVKFKAKSWIDIFGGRSSKALGSSITLRFGTSTSRLLNYGTVFSLILAAGMLVNASLVGRKFEALSRSNVLLGDERQKKDSDDLDEEKEALDP